MNLKKLLPIALLSAMMVSACTTPGTSTSTSTPAGETHGVTITNKEAITAAGFYDTMQRELEIALTPEGNVLLEMTNGNLTVESSDTSIVSVSGVVLTALQEGTVTVTVKYYEAIDTVTVTTAGAKGAPDPVQATCAEVMAAEDTAGGYIYEGWGYLVDWGKETGPNEYGELGLADTPTSTSSDADYMYVYGSFVNPGEGKEGFKWNGTQFVKDYDRDFLTAELTQGLKFGDKIKFRGIRSDYGTTKEVIAQLLEVEKAAEVPATSVTLDSTKLEVIAGATAKLTAKAEPANCNVTPTWTTSDATIATVKDDGTVTGLKAGTATITVAYSETVKATCEVTVIELADNEYLVSSATLGLGKTYTPDTPYTGTSKGVTFAVEGIADYGDGMQFCKVGHDKYNPGSIWNTTAFPDNVAKITLKKSATKSFYDNADALKVEIADNAEFTDAKVEYIDTVKNAETAEIELENKGTFVRISVNLGFTFYFGNIVYTTEAEAAAEKVTLTATSLGLTDTYSKGSVEVDGYTVNYVELYTKDAGIQMRAKDKTAETRSQISIDFGTKKITKIEFTYHSAKSTYDNKDVLEFAYNGNAEVVQLLSLTAGEKFYTVTPTVEATSIHLAQNLAHTYTMYWESIVFYLA